MGGKKFICGAKFLLLPGLISVLGCAHLIIYDDDSGPAATGKVLTRLILCPMTLCLSELTIGSIKDDLTEPSPLAVTESHDLRLMAPMASQQVAVWGDHAAAVVLVMQRLQNMGLRMIERARLQTLLDEQHITLRAATERDADLLRVGALAGATQVVFVEVSIQPELQRLGHWDLRVYEGTGGGGGFEREYTLYHINVSLRSVSVETGMVRWTGSGVWNHPVSNPNEAVKIAVDEVMNRMACVFNPKTHTWREYNPWRRLAWGCVRKDEAAANASN